MIKVNPYEFFAFGIIYIYISKLPTLMLSLSLVFTNKWHLPILLFIRFSANHLNKISDYFSKDCMTSSLLCLYAYIWCVAAAKLAISILPTMKNKSAKSMLNNTGQRIESCRTPKQFWAIHYMINLFLTLAFY